MKTIYDIVWEAIHTGKNAEPWVVYGVETLAAGATKINPTPSKTDLVGEVSYLPYIVPQNSVLVILGIHVSSDSSCTRQAHVKIKITRAGINAVTLYDLIKCSEHNEHHAHIGSWIREGSSVRVDVVNAFTSSNIVRYYIEGILVDISDAYKKQ